MRSAIAILLLLVSSAALASPSGGSHGGAGGGGGGGGHATAGGAHSVGAGGASRASASHGGLGYYGGLSSYSTGRLGTHIVLGNNTAATTVAERDRTVAPPKPNPNPPNLSWWRHRHDHGWLESSVPMWVPPPICSEGQRLLGHCVGGSQRAAARR